MIFHITSRSAGDEAQRHGSYRAESLSADGFIHCSTEKLVLPVAEVFYKGQQGLILLLIEPTRLPSDLKWEPPWGGSLPQGVPTDELFPHIYGPINLNAVVKVLDFEPDTNRNQIVVKVSGFGIV